MSITPYIILIVEDDKALSSLIEITLKDSGFETETVFKGCDALSALDRDIKYLLLLDYNLPDLNAMDLINKLKKKSEEIPFIVMTGHGSEAIAVELMKLGARDYLIKDQGFIEFLPGVINRVIDQLKLEKLLKNSEEDKSKLETQLRQSQKLQTIGTLAGGIAHEFNNILSVIIGYSDMALDDAPENSHIRSNLLHVLKASNRGKELVKQILTFSRKFEQKQKPVEIHLVVEDTLKLIRGILPSTIKIQQNINPESGYIMADPTQIHQVVMNLCINAYHAMGDIGGTLKISLDLIQADTEFTKVHPNLQEGTFVEIIIKDTGHGISPEIMNRIFEPFYTTKEVGSGTGLGLSIVHGIIISHGGEINVSSEPGEGTTFNLYLPIYNDLNEETIDRENIMSDIKRRLLFVDDEKEIADMTKKMLEQLGYEVTASTDSAEALETFRKEPDKFDMVITDQVMPNMTGIQLADKITQIKSTVPIILVTGYEHTIPGDEAKKFGINKYIMKPIVSNDINSVITQIFEEI